MMDWKVDRGTGHPFVPKEDTAHAERLQAARDESGDAMVALFERLTDDPCVMLSVTGAIDHLIDAKVALALLERGGG